MKNKIVKFNAVILLIITILLTVKIQVIGQYSIYLVYIFQLICIAYNIAKNKEKKINYIKITIAVVILFLITLIIDVFGDYTESTIVTTIIVFANIILLSIMIGTTEKEISNNVYKKFCVYFFKYVILITMYAIIIRFFGGMPTYYETTESGSFQYRQVINILGVQFSQIVMGDNSSLGFGVASITENPNTLSYLILFAEIIYIFYLSYNDTKLKKILYVIILSIGIIIAGSRLAILLFILFFIVRIFFISKLDINENKEKSLFKIIVGIAIITILFLILSLGKYNILESLDLNGRENIWEVAFEEIKSNTLDANGLGSADEILKDKLKTETSMHNIYLKLILEYGIIITSIFIIYNIYILIKSVKLLLKITNEEDSNRILLQILIFMTILIIGLSESTIMTLSIYNILYFYNIFNIQIAFKQFKASCNK